MFGNGLRPKIWNRFVHRFGVKRIGEFYGSTEGNANIINFDSREGSCGFVSRIAPFVYPVTLIKVNELTGEPFRDANGMCIKAQPGEVGEFVGKIIDKDPIRSFDGYVNKEATNKKILRNVFWKGDKAFSSGDLLTMDEFGYLYFKDRTGDTFRWKGENVATMEIEAVVSNIVKLSDCIVYGVEIAGCEGKAGMATILDPNRTINLDNLSQELRKVLPAFSVPLFIRIVQHLEITGTFKLPKNVLQKEGYDPKVVKDPLYYYDNVLKNYATLDEAAYDRIQKGEVKF